MWSDIDSVVVPATWNHPESCHAVATRIQALGRHQHSGAQLDIRIQELGSPSGFRSVARDPDSGSWVDMRIRPRERAGDFRASEPGRDPAVLARIDAEQHAATVEQRSSGPDEAGVPHQMKLSSCRRSTETDFGGEARRPSRSDRQARDDPPPKRIGQQVDPVAVSPGHVAHNLDHRRPLLAADKSPLTRPSPARHTAFADVVPLDWNHLKSDHQGTCSPPLDRWTGSPPQDRKDGELDEAARWRRGGGEVAATGDENRSRGGGGMEPRLKRLATRGSCGRSRAAGSGSSPPRSRSASRPGRSAQRDTRRRSRSRRESGSRCWWRAN